MGIQKAGKTALRKLERKTQALELRRAGMSYAQIARKLGLVKASVWKLVQEALISTIQEPADAVRALELERLDHLTKKLETQIETGDRKSIETLLKVMDHRARLLGLYAPVKLQGPDGAPVRFVVEVPAPVPSLADWQAQAAAVIDVTPRPELGMELETIDVQGQGQEVEHAEQS